jgi:hypothetical protein
MGEGLAGHEVLIRESPGMTSISEAWAFTPILDDE